MTHCLPHSSSQTTNSDKLYELLHEIQLEHFWPALRDQLQITRISHFDFVKQNDLEKIGMSKPAIRRLLDSVNKIKKTPLKVRPPPPPPLPNKPPLINTQNQSNTLQSLYNNNVTKLLSFRQKKSESKQESSPSYSTRPTSVSFIINPNDIQIVKSNTGDDILGSGQFGVVKKAIWYSPSGSKMTVAVKCLHDKNIESNLDNKQQAFLDIVNEISCMCGLDHKNLIKLYGVVLNGSSNENSMIMMVTELALHGSLLKFLRKHRQLKQILSITQLYSYAYQIADGMEYLENKKIVHRDLAARNILLHTLDQVKICDFGMSICVNNDGSFTKKEADKIPCAWYPPESIREKLFSIKSDVWAFGVTVWEIFTYCEQPWPNMSAGEILNKIETQNQRLPKPFFCSKNFYKIILNCWSTAPSDRPSFQTLKILIKETKITEMRAKESFKQENKLEIERGDMIRIIEGDAEKYWWKGQNCRTQLVGYFPRVMLNTQRKLNSEDISMPLRNSFIHTGHMGISSNEKTWGNPGKIDDLFLRNPLNPPDLLEDLNEEDQIVENRADKDDKISQNLIDLLDLFDSQNEKRVTSQDCSMSLNSFESTKSDSASSQSSNYSGTIVTKEPQLYINEQYVPYQSYSQAQVEQRSYYNDISVFKKEDTSVNSGKALRPTNPFLKNSIELTSQRNEYENKFSENDDLIKNISESNSKSKFDISQFNITDSSKKVNVDDFLNKVLSDVLNDFKNIKFNQ